MKRYWEDKEKINEQILHAFTILKNNIKSWNKKQNVTIRKLVLKSLFNIKTFTK